MKSFKELKELSQNFLEENLNELEKTISLFLIDEDVDLDIIEMNLEAFLDNYVYPETIVLANKVISLNNLDKFLLHSREEVKNIALDFIKDSEEISSFNGLLDPDSLIFTCESYQDSLILSQAPEIISKDLKDLLEEAEELMISPNKIKAKIKKVINQTGFSFELSLSNTSNKEKSRRENLMRKLKAPVQAGIMALAIFSGAGAYAGDGQEALKHAGKAAMNTEEGKLLKTYAEAQAKKIEKIVKDSGGEIPAIIAGYGAKVAIEGKVEVGGKLTEEGNTRYAVESDFENVSVKISGDGPEFLDNSRYQFNAGTDALSFHLGFDF